MTAGSGLVLAAATCALPWAWHRGLTDMGESLHCAAADYAVLAAGALLAVLCIARNDPSGALLCASVAVSAVTDIRRGVILDRVVIVSLVSIGIVATIAGSMPAMVTGGAVSFAAMGTVFVAGRGAMGLGDVKLASVLGAGLGVQGGLLALASAFVLAGLIAATLLAFKRVRRDQALPFAPYLAVGTSVALCYSWAVPT